MKGIPCDVPYYVYGDNQSVLVNSSKSFSMLNKKYSPIAHHVVREGIAKDIWQVTYISTHNKFADIIMK